MPRNALEIGRERRYRCPAHPDATPYVSVTTSLNHSMEWGVPAGHAAKVTAEWSFDHADEWLGMGRDDALRLMKSQHVAKRDKAADAGTLCHAAAERVISGVDWREPTPATGYALPDELWPVAEHIEAWWASSGLSVVLVERSVWNHRAQYAGTLDALVTDGERHYILDLKTQSTPTPDKWRLQLAAYADAEEWSDDADQMHPMAPVAGGLVLWIPQRDPAAAQLWRVDIGTETRAAYQAVLASWRFFKRATDEGGEVAWTAQGGKAA